MSLRKIATRPYRESSYLFPTSLTAKRKASYDAPSCRQGCSRLRHWPRPLLKQASSSRLRLLNLYTIRVGYVPSKKYYAPRRSRKYARLGLKRERPDLRKRAQGEVPEDRCQSAGRTPADLILFRPGEGKRSFTAGTDACDGGVGACEWPFDVPRCDARSVRWTSSVLLASR